MTNSEQRNCQNCKQDFQIEPEDFAFYEKMSVVPPDICACCGIQRTMLWRNEHTLYNGVCKKCSRKSLSMYHSKSPFTVYCHDCWWSDDWEGASYAKSYEPNRPLLEQFKELQKVVPREALVILNSENCDHSNHVRHSKNCYMGNLITWCEDLYYCEWMVKTRDSLDVKKANESEFVIECIDIIKCARSAYLQDCTDCTDCFFSYDLKGCTDCIFSSNLRGKSHHIFNRPVEKDEYNRRKKEMLDGSFKTLKKNIEKYNDLRVKAIRKYAPNLKINNCTGSFIENANRLRYCFDAIDCEDVKDSASLGGAKDGAYSYSMGFPTAELFFGSCVMRGGSNIKFSFNTVTSDNCTYGDSLISCNECIACIGMKNKNHCILNKQYNKDEYFMIKKDLERKGELGIFPNYTFSTFAYNESAAQTQYPLTKDEAKRRGYDWQEDIPSTTGKETKEPADLPDNIKDISDSILKEILKCTKCARNYRIVQRELDYYRQFSLPLPRECSPCRMSRRRNERVPYRLWPRQCMCNGATSDTEHGTSYQNTAEHFHGSDPCPNEFQTSYSPERKEVVYCESCYNSEVV
jgi:hypothetical protein